jgi:periplasmic protein TonB
MNVTTLSRDYHYPVDIGLAIPDPAEKVSRGAARRADGPHRSGKSMMPGIALSSILHAGVLAVVLFAVANPFVSFPTEGDEGVVRVSLVTVMPGPENGNAAPAEEIKKAPVARAISTPNLPQKAMEKTVTPTAVDSRPGEKETMETSVSIEPAKGSFAAAATSAGGQREPGTAQEGYSEAMPRYRENRPPVYPRVARQRGYEGNVLIAAEVRADGQIGAVRVKRTSGYASLDDSALETVRVWRFEPARRMGAAVDAWVEIPIRFKLSTGDSLM